MIIYIPYNMESYKTCQTETISETNQLIYPIGFTVNNLNIFIWRMWIEILFISIILEISLKPFTHENQIW